MNEIIDEPHHSLHPRILGTLVAAHPDIMAIMEAARGTPVFAAMRDEYHAGLDPVEAARTVAIEEWDALRQPEDDIRP